MAYKFFLNQADQDIIGGGTAGRLNAIGSEGILRDEFFKAIKRFEAGRLPKNAAFAKADREMNNLYSELMSPTLAENKYFADFKKEFQNGIKITQQEWIDYRNAWVKFAKVKYPGRSPDVWKAWLTQQPIKQLKEFAERLN